MKGQPWCAKLPLVTVPRSDVPKRLTLVTPYYENPKFFRTQLEHWSLLPVDVRDRLTVIVVDDGSPTQPAEAVYERFALRSFALRLFRIDVDVRWNWLAARNIGFHYAADAWVLVTDIDHVVPVETFRSILFSAHDRQVVYAFQRREHTGAWITPHSASFLMTRSLFWTIGGYDETLSGHYGTDGEFRRRIVQYAPIHLLSDPLVRHEYVEDSSTTHYRRKQPEDAAVRQLIAQRGKKWRPKVLSFPYHEVTSCLVT